MQLAESAIVDVDNVAAPHVPDVVAVFGGSCPLKKHPEDQKKQKERKEEKEGERERETEKRSKTH